jgi:tetratricopeptide (TPR) repeat protein
MFRCVLGLSLLLAAFSSVSAQTAQSAEEIQAVLSRAEALYYEAEYKETIQLLTPVDVALKDQPGRIPESIKVKLQLALAHMGLNETAEAQARFEELCRLDSNYELDSQQFAPKVIALFSEVRNGQVKSRCFAACSEAKKMLDAGNFQGLLAFIESGPKNCDCLEGLALDASDLVLKEGIEEYKNNDIPRSIKSFRMALAFNPNQQVATQYIDLAQNKLQYTVDRLLLDWRRHFDAAEFPEARTAYRQILEADVTQKSAAALEQARTEYRKYAAVIAETWKQNCSAAVPALSLNTVKDGLTGVLPDPAIARDILDQLKPCAPPPLVTQPCLQLQTQAAMVRLKRRVDPQIPRSVRPTSSVSIIVKITIDKLGSVMVKDIQSPSLALVAPIKTAVEQWKFAPATLGDKDRPQCVDTELPILLNP